MKEETCNNPSENVIFVIEFDLQEDRDLILRLGPWFCRSLDLYMKLWISTFDPVMDSLASAHVWVMILNMPFHFLGKPSLNPLGMLWESSTFPS